MISLKLLLPISFLPIILIGIYFVTGIPENNLFFITNFLILITSFFGMFIFPLRLYSLFKVAFIFIFIFFGIVPLMNEVNNNIIWGGEFDILDKTKTNLIILFGMIFFIFGGCSKVNSFDRIVNSLPDIKRLNIFFYILFCLVAFIILYKWNFNINSLLFWSTRGEAGYFHDVFDIARDGRLDFLIYSKVIRPMPIVFLVIFFYFFKKNKKLHNYNQKLNNLILLCFLTLLSIILVSPTGMARWQTATLYIPLLIIFTRIWEIPFMMQTSLLGGLFIVFPFLDKFRAFTTFENFDFKINYSWVKQSHFDSYQNFVRVVEVDFITYGHQLMGALLFFVPRSFWNEKPIGSGSTLAIKMDYIFGGISMPFIAEGYVNFGFIGSLLFMFFLGIVLGNLDRIAWKLKRANKDCLFLYYYYFLFGLIFFTMRGDLINGIAFISGMTASFWMLVLILGFTARIRVKT
jgi:hypothetical protein